MNEATLRCEDERPEQHPALRITYIRPTLTLPWTVIVSKVGDDGTITDLELTQSEAEYFCATVLYRDHTN
jgi:hypothetical protein